MATASPTTHSCWQPARPIPYFGNDEWEAVAPGLKTLEDATTIRRRLLLAFERAEIETDPAAREALLTFTIIGAGPTGVELAGIISELAQSTLPKEFRRIDTRTTRVILVEAGPRVLPGFSEDLSAYAHRALEKRGVEVRTGQRVTACTHAEVTIDDSLVACRTMVWAAGVQASPAARWLGIEADRAGRAVVEKNLTAAWSSGYLRHRRHGFGVAGGRHSGTRYRARGKAAGSFRRKGHPGEVERPGGTRRVSLSPPGQPGNDRQAVGDHRFRTLQNEGDARLVDMGDRSYLLPHRHAQPFRGRLELALELPPRPSQRAADYAEGDHARWIR